ncbi:hypothetical protein Nwi_3089 [Nitrobacter winogradskyi Nb-255]|uniref:ParB-like nuclease n=1 Tax=Nitrobacter winogradskyi (strain ATCC 25391 / DSM 10237 / CIP 104748 / NCIMB 11846 / Nb-255) TaxID=323098 RepID=Q3SN05_NITWN|nr:hypothetical protein Nwi_3089 [Nitrobacter winogradskyi Nb-255]
MVDGGMSTEEVASTYFTSQRYVDQRLALAKVSPRLHEVYAQDGMTLAMLEAFTAHPDHARQEQVWDAVERSHYREPWRIRNMLTETTVAASDKRALFVGIEAYMAAGGQMLPRYLFDDDEDGWLKDVSLLDRLVAEKLKVVADEVAAEGWKWITVDLELPYGHDHGLRAITGAFAELTRKEQRQREKLREEQERLETEYADYDELPDDIDQRLGEIEKQLDAFERRPAVYDPAEIAIAGVFITVDEDGALARVTGLDMADAGFRPTVANYLGRITKPRILQAVHEALGEEKVRLIDHLKKDDMAREAERLLADTGWLPEPLRLVAEAPAAETSAGQNGDDVALPEFFADDDDGAADEATGDPTPLIAAE